MRSPTGARKQRIVLLQYENADCRPRTAVHPFERRTKSPETDEHPAGIEDREIDMEQNAIPLNELPVGKKARVVSLRSDGSERRRMLDLGVIGNTEIEALYKSPSGNPVAYFIRGAVIALRNDVSGMIMVSAS